MVKLLRPANTPFVLISIYLLSVLTISLRVAVEPGHYTTPDSGYYLAAAESIMEGEGLWIKPAAAGLNDTVDERMYLAIFPAGYPLLIAAVSAVTGLPPLPASKIVNLIFLGLTIWLLWKWIGYLAWVPSLYFFSYAMLEVYSHTWSEGPFMFFVVLLCYFLDKNRIGPGNALSFLWIFLLLASIFLLRYAGVIFFGVVSGWMIFHFYKKEYRRSLHYLVGMVMSGILVFAYLFNNLQLTGYYTGMERVDLDEEPIIYFSGMVMEGLFNVFLIPRNYWGQWEPVLLFVIAVQLIVLLVVVRKSKEAELTFVASARAKSALAVALTYLVGIIVMVKVVPVDSLNYRLLAPFSMLFYLALAQTINESNYTRFVRYVAPWVVGFALFSLIMNLPKQYIIELFTAK